MPSNMIIDLQTSQSSSQKKFYFNICPKQTNYNDNMIYKENLIINFTLILSLAASARVSYNLQASKLRGDHFRPKRFKLFATLSLTLSRIFHS